MSIHVRAGNGHLLDISGARSLPVNVGDRSSEQDLWVGGGLLSTGDAYMTGRVDA